jgi:hypothetical protein
MEEDDRVGAWPTRDAVYAEIDVANPYTMYSVDFLHVYTALGQAATGAKMDEVLRKASRINVCAPSRSLGAEPMCVELRASVFFNRIIPARPLSRSIADSRV